MIRDRKLTKKEIAFVKKEFSVAEDAIIHSGGKKISDGPFESPRYTVETICGPLEITLDTHPYSLLSIFCRFKDVEKANKHWEKELAQYNGQCRLNRYSGKWNFHGEDATDLVAQFFLEFNKIVPSKGE